MTHRLAAFPVVMSFIPHVCKCGSKNNRSVTQLYHPIRLSICLVMSYPLASTNCSSHVLFVVARCSLPPFHEPPHLTKNQLIPSVLQLCRLPPKWLKFPWLIQPHQTRRLKEKWVSIWSVLVLISFQTEEVSHPSVQEQPEPLRPPVPLPPSGCTIDCFSSIIEQY